MGIWAPKSSLAMWAIQAHYLAVKVECSRRFWGEVKVASLFVYAGLSGRFAECGWLWPEAEDVEWTIAARAK